jgi:glycosyltransferase involved in cell wall biosynthesis
MNILLVNHYAGSPRYGMEYRPYYLAREWTKAGHQVSIVAASYSHLRTRQPFVNKDFQIEHKDVINYYWLKTPSYENSGIKRIWNMLTFVRKLYQYSHKICKQVNPDIVIASSTYPLDIYPAYQIAKRNNAKLVFELHDLWPLSPRLIGGYSKYHPFIWLLQQAENFACKRSDCYISLLGNTKEYLIKHGLKANKFFHIPNGFSLEELNEEKESIPAYHQKEIEKIKQKHEILIGYAGSIAPSNAMRTFIDATHSFINENKLAFVIVGNGPHKAELMAVVESRKQSNIYFLPPVPKQSIPDLLEKFDLLYAGGTKSILHSYGTSYNKITDYMLAEKPIIFAVDEPNSLVEQVGCGIQIPAEDKAELVKTIKFISEMSAEERTRMGKKGREYALKELNYTSLAEKFIDAIISFR